jgi:hypothetical protein
MFAARNGNPRAVKLLIEAGADVNAREKLRGTTALMWATEQRHAEAVKVLLASGADPATKSAGAGLPRNYMANRVNTRTVRSRAGAPEARGRRGAHLRGAARGRTERKGASSVGSAASGRLSGRTGSRSATRQIAGAVRDSLPRGPAAQPAAAGRARGAGDRRICKARARPPRSPMTTTKCFAGLVGSGGAASRRSPSRRARATSSRPRRCSTPAPT